MSENQRGGDAITTTVNASQADELRLRWSFGSVEFDESTMELRRLGQLVEIEPKPLELLMFMLRHVGEVVTREEILQSLWLGRVVTDGVITNCIGKLRTALGDDDQSIIRTVPRYGYRLVAEVRRLLAQEAPAAPSNDLNLKVGDSLPLRPNWSLVRQLSAGVHGEVWLAEREKSKEQRVIKFARNRAGLSALKREITLYRVLSETLGDPVHFVRLLDWNIEQTPFFLETEFSAQGNLVDWCESQGGVARLPLPVRVDIAAQCAAAVAASHSAGVLHKDLKPANIIIHLDAQQRPQIRLCDFAAGHALHPDRLQQLGITRLGFTQTFAVADSAGTPLYLPPEVLAGQPPTQLTDVYSLGILLFQLVVGDFKRTPVPGWEEQVSDPLLREDISLAAAGDSRRRLGDAGQLALRLRSLSTRRAEWEAQQQNQIRAERLREAVKRADARRGPLLALTVILTAGMAVTGWLYRDARIARDEAIAQSEAALAVQQFLADDLLGAANPLTSNGPDLRVRDLLEASTQTLDRRFAQSSVTKAKLQSVIGSAYGALGDIDKAESLLLAAERVLAQELGDVHVDTQAARLALRDSYRIDQRLDKLGAVAERIVAAENAAGRPNLAMWFEGESTLRFTRCIAEYGALWLADCSAPVRELVSLAREQLGPRHPVTGRLLWLSGVLMIYGDRAAAAEPTLREALSIYTEHLAPGNSKLAEARLYWAASLRAIGKPQQAKPIMLEVVRDFESSVGRRGFYTIARVFLARTLLDLGETTEALSILREAYVWRLKTYGADNIGTSNGLNTLARALMANGRADEAVQLLQGNAQAIAQMGERADPVKTLRTNVLLADALRAAGRDAEAAPLLQANLADARKRFVRGQWLLPYVAGQWGQWLVDHQRAADGEPLLREAAEGLRKSLGEQDPRSLAASAAWKEAARRI